MHSRTLAQRSGLAPLWSSAMTSIYDLASKLEVPMQDVVAVLMRHGILRSAREPLTTEQAEIVRVELADVPPPSTEKG